MTGPTLLFAGDYPDPSIVRVDDTYYITHSSFVYHPGLLIWESKDLQSWRPVGFAVDQPGWDIWAPELVHHGDRFYVYYYARSTTGDGRGTNWVVHAPSASGPWSAPVQIPIERIDPGHVVGPDGRRYLHFSGGTAAPLTDDGLSLTGELETVYAGWPYPDDWRVEGFFVEGPKLVQREGWYYLTSAQGGTAGPATSHMAVVARSRSPLGPWENSPYNPLVHTWSRGEEWWSTGHATIFDTPHGDSYAVYHGYRAGMHTLGRQTLVAPVHWNAGWPVVDLGDRCDQDGPVAGGLVRSLVPMDPSDDFDSPSLGVQWRRFDLLPTDHIESGAGSLRIRCSGTRGRPPQPLVCTPGDVVYRVEVTVGRTELTDDACAGLVLYYDERSFAGLLVDGKGRVIVAREGAITSRVLAEEADQTVRLAIVNDRHEVEFHLREHDGWRRLDAALDVAGYNHNVFGRFLSLRAGLMAVGTGTATFSMFRYESGVGI